MIKLERKLRCSCRLQDSESFKSIGTCLCDYHSPAISNICTSAYSKLETIRQLAAHTPRRDEAWDLIRALLTDRGLLFPQTREQFYSEDCYSMRRNCQFSGLYASALRDMGIDENTDLPTRARTFARQAYDQGEYAVPFVRVSQALETMLQDCKRGCFPQIEDCEDVGYSKAELSALEQSSAAPGTGPGLHAAEAIMERWLKTVRLTFDGQTTVLGLDYLQAKLEFTVEESYKFFSEILLPCMSQEKEYQICRERTRPYEPVLYADQEPEWRRQIDEFGSEDLSLWRRALPALEQYLKPDLSRFGRGACLGDSSDTAGSRYQTLLGNAFSSYLEHLEPENQAADVEAMAAYFVCSTCGVDDETPLFMDMPAVIFQLFRSPVYRYFYQYEDRNWNLRKTVENSCVRFPLPITCQSLEADKELYLAIVDICEGYCHVQDVTFDAPSWRALWGCIGQCVRSLSFRKEDLFTVRYTLRNLLRFRKKGYPLLDQILSDKLESGDSSAYISLWRTLINKKLRSKVTFEKSDSSIDTPTDERCLKSVRDRRLDEFSETVSQYRRLFENPETDIEQISDCLWPLCAGTGFNKIAFLPDREEWKELACEWDLCPRARKGPISTIQSARDPHAQMDAQEVTHIPRSVDMILTEWLMLQCSCDQAQREMMTVICELLRE